MPLYCCPRDVSLSDSKCWNGGQKWVLFMGTMFNVATFFSLLLVLSLQIICFASIRIILYSILGSFGCSRMGDCSTLAGEKEKYLCYELYSKFKHLEFNIYISNYTLNSNESNRLFRNAGRNNQNNFRRLLELVTDISS